MTNLEFSNAFDIYYNNIMSDAAPGLSEYEKSVFLTDAQKDIIIELYSGRNVAGISFESTEEARIYLRELEKSLKVLDNFDSILLEDDVWFITLEECKFKSEDECIASKTPKVVPIKQDLLLDILENPFRGPKGTDVIRADIDGKLKLFSKYLIDSYTIHYLKKPSPIILEDLGQNTIEGISTESECELNPIVHRAILLKAVALAKQAYIQ